MKAIPIKNAILKLHGANEEDAIQQMKAEISGQPSTAEIEGELVVILIEK